MDRREMLRRAGLAAVAAGVSGPRAALARASDGADAGGARPHDPDFPIVSGLDVSTLDERYLGMLKAGGVDCWHKSAAGVLPIGEVLAFVDEHPRDLTVATTVRQIEQAYRDRRIAIVFGSQSADGLENVRGEELGGALGAALRQSTAYKNALRSALRGHYELGLRIQGIAYNLPNRFGSGNFFPYMGLTADGRALVEEIHRLRIILDVGGHTGEQTSLDAIAIAPEIPAICSHSNIQRIADNPRNISDRLIEAIARTGGVIGLTAVNDFHVRTRNEMHVPHSPRRTVEHFVDQMDYLKKLVGVDHIGIGPDFVEGRTLNYDALNRTPSINRMIISDGPWLYVQGFENISEVPNVIRTLERRGWPRADIARVMGGNWLRVYRKVWGE